MKNIFSEVLDREPLPDNKKINKFYTVSDYIEAVYEHIHKERYGELIKDAISFLEISHTELDGLLIEIICSNLYCDVSFISQIIASKGKRHEYFLSELGVFGSENKKTVERFRKRLNPERLTERKRKIILPNQENYAYYIPTLAKVFRETLFVKRKDIFDISEVFFDVFKALFYDTDEQVKDDRRTTDIELIKSYRLWEFTTDTLIQASNTYQEVITGTSNYKYAELNLIEKLFGLITLSSIVEQDFTKAEIRLVADGLSKLHSLGYCNMTELIVGKVRKNNIEAFRDFIEEYIYPLCSDKQEVTTQINSWLDNEREDTHKFTSRDTDEAYRCLITNATIQREALESAYNKPYVLCQNGVLELPSMKLLPFSPKYEFTSGIKASYDENTQGKHFKEFIDFATNGDTELKHLIQEIMGYALSNYSNKRIAFVFEGVTGTGKSTILDVIRQMVGQDLTCEVPLNFMEREYYAATILSSKLNIVPDHNDAVIKDVAKFKSFVSDTDVISGRNPCEKPFAERCRTKMLFGSNHFFRFSGVKAEDLEAFFDRILYIPFNRKIEKKIGAFWEILKPEYDYIFTWAMKGLKRLFEQDFEFTRCSASEKMKISAMAQCNPEEAFFENCLKSAEDRYESSSAITEAFRYFCNKNKIEGNFNITTYLEKKNIPKMRKRINESGYLSSEGNPIYVYEGIRLRAKYRVS